MNCPRCGSGTRVLETRHLPENQTRRRRVCVYCGQRFTTYEITNVEKAYYELAVRKVRKGEQK